MADPKIDTKKTLVQYIANNLVRMANKKDSQTSLILLMAASSILNTGDDPQTIAMARRLATLAISKSNKGK